MFMLFWIKFGFLKNFLKIIDYNTDKKKFKCLKQKKAFNLKKKLKMFHKRKEISEQLLLLWNTKPFSL